MGTDGNIRLMDRVKPTGIIGIPTFLYHILNQAVQEGKRFETLQSLVLGGEKVPAGMRRKLTYLAQQLGSTDVSVVATYGFTESKMAWGECPHPLESESGGYHLYPDLGLFEVIDPDSGEVQLDGQPGELVFTPLNARGTTVRYRTGDIIDGGLVYDVCPYCKRRMPRLMGNISRRSDIKEMRLGKIKGTLVDFNELEKALDDVDHIGAWQIEWRKINDDPMKLDEIILHIEPLGTENEEQLLHIVTERFKALTELKPNRVCFHTSAEMREMHGVGTELKEKRLMDHRP